MSAAPVARGDVVAGKYLVDRVLATGGVNVETEPQIARRYGVRSQPTLMIFKQGSVEAQKVGALSKSQLKAFIEVNL